MDERTCAQCRAALPTERRAYCSDRCRQAFRMRRRYRRRKGLPLDIPAGMLSRAERTPRLCGQPDCDRKHLARGLCRRHYYQARRDAGLDGSANVCDILMSMASLHGAYFPKPKPVTVRITVGVMVDCPACPEIMAALNPTERICRSCGTTATLNQEEVEWLTSQARSRRASLPTAS